MRTGWREELPVDRRRSLRVSARIQRRLFRRAWRRLGAQRMDRAILRPAPDDGVGGSKSLFDPLNLMNPGKIVRPSKQDDRNLFRFKPDYRHIDIKPALDWSDWGGLTMPPRCATTTAIAANSTPARCARPIASRATSNIRPVAAPILCGSRYRAAGGADALASDAMRETLLCAFLQRLQARVPDRRRYGEDEDRIFASTSAAAWPIDKRQAHRLSTALCAVRGEVQPATESARRHPAPRTMERGKTRLQRPAAATQMAARLFSG